MSMTLYSFDIFDTLLLRAVPSHNDIFALMDQDGEVIRLFGKSFSKVRIFAERESRFLHGHSTDINKIYDLIGKKHHLDKKTVDYLIDLEFETEKRTSYLNQDCHQQLKKLVSNGERVCLISDMYWPKERLSELLSSKNALYQNVELFISCDFGLEKKNGSLFRRVQEITNADFFSWFHYGDNYRSDYLEPKKLGIKPTLIKRKRCYDFEKRIDFSNIHFSSVYSLIDELRFGKSSEYCLGCSVAGPMVYSYVQWIISQSISKGITHLFFVLRDGYILKKVADLIISEQGLNIKTDFIFGSRIAWRFPNTSIGQGGTFSVWEQSNWLFRDPCYSYVVYERLGFTQKEIIDLFGEPFSKTKLVSFSDFKHSLEFASNNPKFLNDLAEKKKSAKNNLLEYFKQTIDFEENFAFVDTNSTGKTQKDLSSILSETNEKVTAIPFFYHTYLSNNPNPDEQYVFLQAEKEDLRFPEALYRAPYNTCYGYDKKDGKIVPRFFESSYCAWYGSFSYDDYLCGILDFARSALKEKDLFVEEYSSLLMDVVNFNVISKDLYRILAKIPFNPDLKGEERKDFYPQIHFTDLFHPFSKLIYAHKGSYYCKNGFYIILYHFLFSLVRRIRKK